MYIRQVWDPWEIDGGIVTIFPTLFLSYVIVYVRMPLGPLPQDRGHTLQKDDDDTINQRM